jgi:hypothetical protein
MIPLRKFILSQYEESFGHNGNKAGVKKEYFKDREFLDAEYIKSFLKICDDNGNSNITDNTAIILFNLGENIRGQFVDEDKRIIEKGHLVASIATDIYFNSQNEIKNIEFMILYGVAGDRLNAHFVTIKKKTSFDQSRLLKQINNLDSIKSIIKENKGKTLHDIDKYAVIPIFMTFDELKTFFRNLSCNTDAFISSILYLGGSKKYSRSKRRNKYSRYKRRNKYSRSKRRNKRPKTFKFRPKY